VSSVTVKTGRRLTVLFPSISISVCFVFVLTRTKKCFLIGQMNSFLCRPEQGTWFDWADGLVSNNTNQSSCRRTMGYKFSLAGWVLGSSGWRKPNPRADTLEVVSTRKRVCENSFWPLTCVMRYAKGTPAPFSTMWCGYIRANAFCESYTA